MANTSVLQQGVNVLIQLQQNSNGTYTAKSITLTQSGPGNDIPNAAGPNAAGQGQPPAGAAGCFGRGQGSRDRQGNSGVQVINSQGPHILLGTIGQINGTTLTVTDLQQKTSSITLESRPAEGV